MTKNCAGCCKIECGQKVVRKENGMRFEIMNAARRKVKVCRVDGCMIKSEQKKCDFLFIVDSELAIFVELKGQDRTRALYQIIESAETLNSKDFQGEVQSFIVTSSTPKADTKYQVATRRLEARFRKAKCALPKQKNLIFSIKV